jgi:hydrogenase-4 component E
MSLDTILETVIMLILLADMALFSVSLLSTCITLAAVQGILLGVFALCAQRGELTIRIIAIALFSAAVKGVVFPWLLKRAVKQAGVRREIEPFVGFGLSLFLGVILLCVSLWLGSRITFKAVPLHPFAVPASFMTLFTGIFLIVARRKALLQCLGYIICENGIYIFGMAAVGEVPALIELGILLDAFVAVFVMGIVIYQINREFDHIDSDRLSSLKG